MGKSVIAYAKAIIQTRLRIRSDSPEPMMLAHASGKGRELQPKISLGDRACTRKYCFNGKSEEPFSRNAIHIALLSSRDGSTKNDFFTINLSCETPTSSWPVVVCLLAIVSQWRLKSGLCIYELADENVHCLLTDTLVSVLIISMCSKDFHQIMRDAQDDLNLHHIHVVCSETIPF